MNCNLCGLRTPVPPIMDNGHEFCCHGCKAVYRCFGENVLLARDAIQASNSESISATGDEAFLWIDGMHCSSCEYLIERKAKSVNGILDVSTNYATSTAKVIYDSEIINESQLPHVLSQFGYKVRFHNDQCDEGNEEKELLRVVATTALAGMVMMLNLAFYYPTNLGLVDPKDLEPVSWLAYEAAPMAMFILSSVLIFILGFPILRGSWIGIRAYALNMDNLLSIAIFAAYVFSIWQLVIGKLDFYFDVSAVIVGVVTAGRYFERGAKVEATRELRRIIQSWRPIATVERNGNLHRLTIDKLHKGDLVIVKRGEAIPIDGVISIGDGAVDESLLTGEPFPVLRVKGESVLGGSTLVEGEIKFEVGDSVVSQLQNLSQVLWNVQSKGSGTLTVADQISRVFVPIVILLAITVSSLMYMSGLPTDYALLAGLTTLIVSCPCTFGLAVPLTTAIAISTALREGIIITGADLFEKAKNLKTIAFDKTGTLSFGEMEIRETIGSAEVIHYAAAVERLSTHPIAKAIGKLSPTYDASDIHIHPGRGAEAVVNGKNVVVGSKSLFSVIGWSVPGWIDEWRKCYLTDEGVVSYVGWDKQIRGAIITSDRQRPEWEIVLKDIKNHKNVVLLTGAEHACGYDEIVDEVYAGIPPEGKATVINQLKIRGGVAMIGDGSNDSPALAEADLGIAFGAPTTLAVEAADVVIPGNGLRKIPKLFDLISITRLRIRQNIGWAFLYNAIAIPLAITGTLNPLFAALAMGSSSLLVVWNSTRPIFNVVEYEELIVSEKITKQECSELINTI